MKALPVVRLVIPAFEEAARLPNYLKDLAEALEALSFPVRVVVVDDGSSEPSVRACEKAVAMEQSRTSRNAYEFICLPQNRGKGGAVRTGFAEKGDEPLLAFVDADGAVGAAEVVRLLELAQIDPAKAYFASRVKMLGKNVHRKFSRHLSGRIFATCVGVLLDSNVYDSQCGLKIIPTASYRKIEPLLKDDGFSFDLEILAALELIGCPVVEVPIDWREIGESKVRMLRDSTRMLATLLRLRAARKDMAAALGVPLS